MLSKDDLKLVLHELNSLTDKALVCLAVDPSQPKSIADIVSLARPAGVKDLGKSNVTALLTAKKGIVIHTGLGWELTKKGREYVYDLISPHINAVVTKVSGSLRGTLVRIANPQVKNFVEEAIGCFEAGRYRASVVFSWIGAVGLLYDFVIANRLTDFNAEATRRESRWKPAANADDLARMKEHDFLQILAAISIIGKNVKDELETRLKLRNCCGHPSSLQIEENMAAAHVESLILNVFLKFA